MERTVVDDSMADGPEPTVRDEPAAPEPGRPPQPGRPPLPFRPRLAEDDAPEAPMDRTVVDRAGAAASAPDSDAPGGDAFIDQLLRRGRSAVEAAERGFNARADAGDELPPVDQPPQPRGFTHPRFRSDPPEYEEPAPVIPGYEMLGQIGAGGMGAVWKARQTSLDRLVAIKVLPPVLAANGKFIARFRREAMATARLNNPNIISAIDVGETDPAVGPPVHYFVMEFVDGESLEDVAQRERRLPAARVVDMALAVARALDHAWTEAGIVHRDIKPANLLLAKSGMVKVADFGLARCMWESVNLTAAGLAIGTPHYASPEQARGEVDVDARSDIYALGATMFRLLTGRTPFLGHDAATVMARHAREDAPAAHDVDPNVPRELSAIVSRMMQRKANDRYQTLGELIADLERVQKGDRPLAYTRMLVAEEQSLPPEVFDGRPPPGVRARAEARRTPRRRTAASGGGMQWPLAAAAVLFVAATGWGLWYVVERHASPRMGSAPAEAGGTTEPASVGGPSVSFVTSSPGSMVFGGGSFPAGLSSASTVRCMITPKEPGYVYLVMAWADAPGGRLRLRLLSPAGDAAPTYTNTLCNLPVDGGFYPLPESDRLVAFLAVSSPTGANRAALVRRLHAAERKLAADGTRVGGRLPAGRTIWFNHHGPGWALDEGRPATGDIAAALAAACERIADAFDGEARLSGAAFSCASR
jgi:serine/threonine-protein kinase